MGFSLLTQQIPSYVNLVVPPPVIGERERTNLVVRSVRFFCIIICFFIIGTVRRICACVMFYVILNIRTALKFPETLWALVGHLRADDSSTVATEGRRL